MLAASHPATATAEGRSFAGWESIFGCTCSEPIQASLYLYVVRQLPLVYGEIADFMGLEADAREDGGHIVVVPEGLLHKGLQELEIGDAPELYVLLGL